MRETYDFGIFPLLVPTAAHRTLYTSIYWIIIIGHECCWLHEYVYRMSMTDRKTNEYCSGTDLQSTVDTTATLVYFAQGPVWRFVIYSHVLWFFRSRISVVVEFRKDHKGVCVHMDKSELWIASVFAKSHWFSCRLIQTLRIFIYICVHRLNHLKNTNWIEASERFISRPVQSVCWWSLISKKLSYSNSSASISVTIQPFHFSLLTTQWTSASNQLSVSATHLSHVSFFSWTSCTQHSGTRNNDNMLYVVIATSKFVFVCKRNSCRYNWRLALDNHVVWCGTSLAWVSIAHRVELENIVEAADELILRGNFKTKCQICRDDTYIELRERWSWSRQFQTSLGMRMMYKHIAFWLLCRLRMCASSNFNSMCTKCDVSRQSLEIKHSHR